MNGGYQAALDQRARHCHGARERRAYPVADAWLGLTFSPKGDRVYVGGGSQAAVFEFTFADGQADAHAHVRRGRAEEDARSPRFHRRRGALARRPPALRRRPLPRFGGGDQSAVGHGDRALQDRAPPLPHPVPPGRQVVLRHQLDGRHGLAPRDRDGQRQARVRLAPHPTDMVWAPGNETAPKGTSPWVGRIFVAAANTNSVRTGRHRGQGVLPLEVINLALTPRQPRA